MDPIIPEDEIQLNKMKTRFLGFVNKTETCWEWSGTHAGGYGRFSIKEKKHPAHRISYLLFKGEIPRKYHVDHLCKNKMCVNPSHLEAVTHRENVLRANSPIAVNAAKTHCIRGHEFTPENTFKQINGGRGCIACRFNNYVKRYDSNPSEFAIKDQNYYFKNQEYIKARQRAYNKRKKEEKVKK